MNNQNGQDKPLPSVELSLKFMAWDLKQLKEAIIDLNNNFKIYIGMQRAKSTPNDAPPF
jgi:hypothetical protein